MQIVKSQNFIYYFSVYVSKTFLGFKKILKIQDDKSRTVSIYFMVTYQSNFVIKFIETCITELCSELFSYSMKYRCTQMYKLNKHVIYFSIITIIDGDIDCIALYNSDF